MKKSLLILSALAMVFVAKSQVLTKVGSINLGGEGAAEIIAIDETNNRLWVLNNPSQSVVVYDVSTPSNPDSITSVNFTAYGAGVNSIAISGDLVALAVENEVKQMPGKAVFFDANTYEYVGDVNTGALPDMCTFNNAGTALLVANEGEPNDDYTVDPVGSVTIVDGILTRTFLATQVSFSALNAPTLAQGYKYASPNNATFEQDIEPEYIAVAPNDLRAYVTCQESNVVVEIDLITKLAINVYGLGLKDHSLPENALDASDRNDDINITTWPVKGLYQPDAIAFLGTNMIITANEGDARDYDGFSEEERIKDLTLDPSAFPNAAMLQLDENIGRLRVTSAIGDTDNDGDYDELYTYGARSFSIFNVDGSLVYDSGDDFEQITSQMLPDYFNGQDDGGDFTRKDRSDDKGPEPEGIAVADFGNVVYAFIGLERQGGIMVYDVTNAQNPTFIQYINTYDFNSFTGDVSPEGLAYQNLTGSTGLLFASYEVSGTVAIFEVSATVSVEEYTKQINVYPNPSNTGFYNLSETSSGVVLSADGKKILDFQEANTIDLSAQPKGIYVIKAIGSAAKVISRN